MNARVGTALVLVPLGIALMLFAPPVPFALVTSLVVLIGLWEWSRLSGIGSRPVRAAIVAIAALALVWLWLVRNEPVALWIIGVGVAWWLVAFAWLGNFSFGAAPTRENAVMKLIAGVLATMPAWLALVRLHDDAHHGPGWSLFALMLVWAADIGAYFTGRRFGRTKLSPQISPNKTIEGAVGALVAAAVLAVAAGPLLEMHGVAWIAMIALALVTVAASIVGDLFESLVKRQASVKDSGRLFPGHGGIFDRFDSVFAALPVFVLGKALIDVFFAP
jgi:phosphatidate cytidylyltransferase